MNRTERAIICHFSQVEWPLILVSLGTDNGRADKGLEFAHARVRTAESIDWALRTLGSSFGKISIVSFLAIDKVRLFRRNFLWQTASQTLQ